MITTLKKWIYRDKGKVDLILNHNAMIPGEKITGEFLLKGPKSKKKVSRLECDLMLLDKESGTEKMIEVATTIYMSKVIDDKDWTKIPFSYTLPPTLAKCENHASYRFRTRLIFANNVQSIDHDEIKLSETN
ncbi:sporulation protein [Jeotgalibacillus sp. ET6]|uniref:sporulation protein n=1 Tax=Jeotgalibacillus sp. ET6 TaxID=3037260 RepID=UPI00241868EB|nr:sporulation protein [Jeotgalibacillus sp. ET6]MDG5471879.1 sporulation protein [Jeotgalibacillus sp. ET6]